MEVCLFTLAQKMKQNNSPDRATQNEKTEEHPFVNHKEEKVKTDETMEKMKGFLHLLLKEIDKEQESDSKKNHNI
jgi:hypothetical protein